MSALDQAFIKAYSQQNPALAPAAATTPKKSCEQKDPVKAAISVEDASAVAPPPTTRKVEPTVSVAATTKVPSKRKVKKSSDKSVADSVFAAIEQSEGKKTTAKKTAAVKKATSAKKIRKAAPLPACNPPHASQDNAVKTARTKSDEPSVTSLTKRGASDVVYRFDLPMASGAATANVLPTVPAPHTDVIFSTMDTVLPQREPLPGPSVSRSTEPASQKSPVSLKASASAEKKLAYAQLAQTAPSEDQLSQSFSTGWTEDFTRAFSNLDQGTQTTTPSEPVREPESAKTPAEIIESLSTGMKQHAATKTSPKEKKPLREEVALQNKSNYTEQPAAAAKQISSSKDVSQTGRGLPSAMSQTMEKPTVSPNPDAVEPSTAPAIRLFQPMLQVDHFAWPKVCGRLESGADAELDCVIETLLAAQIRGKKVFVLGGCHSGDGATSLLLATARRLAAQGLKVALVEGDWSQPQLARRLGLLPQYGWEDVLAGQLPLEEVLIESIAERLVILPVREQFTAVELPHDVTGRLAETWNSLGRHFDIVLVDPGPLVGSPILDPQFVAVMAGRIDAALLVKDLRKHDQNEFDVVNQSLRNLGTKVLGVVENFVG